jgi:TonB-dependent SusC/RagA subfamily outer membrane receptor
MTGAWMIYALIVGALIAVAAVSAEWMLKSARRPVRFVWITAIALTVVFTVVAPLRVQSPAPSPATQVLALPANVVVAEHVPTVLERIVGSAQTAMETIAQPFDKVMNLVGAAPQIVNRTVAILWIVSAVVATLLLLAVYSRSMRERLHWPRMHVLGRNVRVAPDVGPAVFGVAPPEIVIPRWVLQRNEEEQRLVLEHESEHVRAHDPLLLVVACIAVALMPWHAALWFMWSRLRLAVELDCDGRVLKRGVQKPAYGELLVELSSQRPWDSLAMPAFSWGSSHLEKRLVAMTARPVKFAMARRVAGACVVAFTLVAACRSEMPTAAEILAMDASTVSSRLSRVSDSVVYFVDGKPVAGPQAKAILPESIATVEVLKRNRQRDVAEIHINTLNDSLKVSTLKRTDTQVLARKRNDSTDSPGWSIHLDTLHMRTAEPGDTSSAAMNRAMQITASNRDVMVQSVARDSTQPGERILLRGSQECTGSRVRVRGNVSSTCEPLVYIDGKLTTMASINGGLNPDRIESVEVIKGAAAIATYGPSAINGVILIKLKN